MFSEAEKNFKKILEFNPGDAWKNEWVNRSLRSLYREMNRPELVEEYDKKVVEYNLFTAKNYQKLKATLDKKKIPLLCVQYPLRSVRPLKRIFKGESGVILVDNEQLFREVVGKDGYGVYFRDMFAGDFGHCTRKGNRLLAENIAKHIIKKVFGK